MAEETSFTIQLEQIRDYEFKVKFDWPNVADLLLDEPAPLGTNLGPNASRLVAIAAANCLSASLLFCMRKFKQTPGKMMTTATGILARNERGRLRIGEINVVIKLAESESQLAHLDRCLQQFEDFCVVTDSIRHGIPVHVQITDDADKTVFRN
jgi:organic hydroperoxide reductase OsmC/OhrA